MEKKIVSRFSPTSIPLAFCLLNNCSAPPVIASDRPSVWLLCSSTSTTIMIAEISMTMVKNVCIDTLHSNPDNKSRNLKCVPAFAAAIVRSGFGHTSLVYNVPYGQAKSNSFTTHPPCDPLDPSCRRSVRRRLLVRRCKNL